IAANTNSLQRTAAIFAFGALRADAAPAMPVLLQCLKDSDRAVVGAATEVLGKLRLQREIVVPALSDVKTRPEARLRRLAIEALAGIGRETTRALAVLIKALADSVQLVRYVAAQTLFRLNVDRRLAASQLLAIKADAPDERLEVLMRAQG